MIANMPEAIPYDRSFMPESIILKDKKKPNPTIITVGRMSCFCKFKIARETIDGAQVSSQRRKNGARPSVYKTAALPLCYAGAWEVSYYSGRHAATAIDRRSPPRFAVIFASSARHDKNATLLAHGV